MRLTIAFLLVLCLTPSLAQPGYKIDFKIKGWKDTTIYLGHYYGEQTLIRDTARVNQAGAFYYDNEKTLPQGVYFLVLNNAKVFDFVVSGDQRFIIEGDSKDFFKTATVSGDLDNKLFFENMRFNMERGQEAEPFLKILRDSTLTEEKKKPARESFSKISEQVKVYQQKLIQENPTTLTARLLLATQPIEVPVPPKKADGTIDSTFQLRYYRQHFFDKFDLADDALIRLPRPIYQEKIKEYLQKLYAPVPDTLMKAIDFMVLKAKKNPETYKYLVWNCLFLYTNPEIMGLDEVYVRLYDKYYASGEMNFWITDKVKQNLKDYADKIRGSLVGKTGANLIMQDQNLQPRALYDIKNKYTILWIFDPECGHCKEETPKLVEFYNKFKTKFDVEVFAVASDTSMQKMKTFMKDMKTPWITVNGPRSYIPQHYSKLYYAETTPSLYILDRNHKIIAKKLPVVQLEDFFTKHERFIQSQKNGNKGSQP
ncbi:MAG: redoxin domain-containing protein [Cyclobacteriaceae bacterium]|nr:redoxin domain-containing protein [Cyclobacteriaceae bacterium]